jgi:hypothetical protein
LDNAAASAAGGTSGRCPCGREHLFSKRSSVQIAVQGGNAVLQRWHNEVIALASERPADAARH